MKTEKFETQIEKLIFDSVKKKDFSVFKDKFVSEMRGVAQKMQQMTNT